MPEITRTAVPGTLFLLLLPAKSHCFCPSGSIPLQGQGTRLLLYEICITIKTKCYALNTRAWFTFYPHAPLGLLCILIVRTGVFILSTGGWNLKSSVKFSMLLCHSMCQNRNHIQEIVKKTYMSNDNILIQYLSKWDSPVSLWLDSIV